MHETSPIHSIAWGAARGVAVHACIFPLEVVKVRLQCSAREENSYQVARRVLQGEGAGAFWKGVRPQMVRAASKAWCWPIITHFPGFLERMGIKNLAQQALTGLAIATADAAVTTPLEGAKIKSAFSGEDKFSFRNLRWDGFGMYWAKLSVSWSTFLVAQKYFRDRCREGEQPLTLPQLFTAGVETALVVSVVSAPLDVANTLRQARGEKVAKLFSRNAFRGLPLSALSLTINCVASVFLAEKLSS